MQVFKGNIIGNPKGTNIPLPVSGISKSEGDQVIAAARSGNLKLFVEGEANTPYVYDLMDVHQDQIPNNLKYAPSNTFGHYILSKVNQFYF
ncbi:hypothetical protein [Paenisporosarcina sp. OV554]|uniref:hypothetical protein n=1 Tax=Paenisporosarcina sp. OV554 TaxID=2135694 RepID=UPI000D489AB6|nr:hypothetical protein [Paenisporosarcina sp. OV554]PUB10448.1 hypothetical protein C8K15_11812 [Paenisporosarcina sp. OV554]